MSRLDINSINRMVVSRAMPASRLNVVFGALFVVLLFKLVDVGHAAEANLRLQTIADICGFRSASGQRVIRACAQVDIHGTNLVFGVTGGYGGLICGTRGPISVGLR